MGIDVTLAVIYKFAQFLTTVSKKDREGKM